MTEGFKTVNEKLDKVENEVRKTNNVIENEIKLKMDALFDGHVQNKKGFSSGAGTKKKLRKLLGD